MRALLPPPNLSSTQGPGSLRGFFHRPCRKPDRQGGLGVAGRGDEDNNEGAKGSKAAKTDPCTEDTELHRVTSPAPPTLRRRLQRHNHGFTRMGTDLIRLGIAGGAPARRRFDAVPGVRRTDCHRPDAPVTPAALATHILTLTPLPSSPGTPRRRAGAPDFDVPGHSATNYRSVYEPAISLTAVGSRPGGSVGATCRVIAAGSALQRPLDAQPTSG